MRNNRKLSVDTGTRAAQSWAVAAAALCVGCTDTELPLAPEGIGPGPAGLSVLEPSADFDDAVETRLTFGGHQRHPDIEGTRVVFEDTRHGNEEIYLLDVGTRTETRITNAPGNQRRPRISGDRIVWEDHRDGNPDIYMYDLSSGTEVAIETDASRQTEPDISGDRIVWTDDRDKTGFVDFKIYTHDLSTGTTSRLVSRNGVQPEIDGDWVGYTRPSPSDVFAYNIATGEDRRVTNSAFNQFMGDISGTRIVYDGAQTGAWDVYLYDLETGETRPIVSGQRTQNMVAIDGTIVAWGDQRDSKWVDIFMRDLATGVETKITPSPQGSFRWWPRVSGNRIVWYDGRHGNDDIFMYGPPLPSLPPTVSLDGPSSGDEGSTLSFSGGGSSDPEDDALTFAWDFGDGSPSESGPASTHAVRTHAFVDQGTYTVTLAVDDGVSTDEATLTVEIANVGPTATFVAPADPVEVGRSFELALTDPIDPSSADVAAGFSYAFDCGGGSFGSAGPTAMATCVPSAGGKLEVRGRIADKDGGASVYSAIVVAIQPVDVDVLPGSDTNPFNLRGRGNGVLPVAVLGGTYFEVTAIDVATVTLGDGEGLDTPLERRGRSRHMASLEDVNGDGLADLLLHFSRRALIDNGDVNAATTRLLLRGGTHDGTPIEGADHVRILGGTF